MTGGDGLAAITSALIARPERLTGLWRGLEICRETAITLIDARSRVRHSGSRYVAGLGTLRPL